jgi:hypothetical protein
MNIGNRVIDLALCYRPGTAAAEAATQKISKAAVKRYSTLKHLNFF